MSFRLFSSFFVVLLLLAPGQIPSASAQQAAFTSDVRMDVSAASASGAREIAMKQAESKGLSGLIEKLAPEQLNTVSSLSEEEISGMVRGVEILDEKIAGSRYRALMRVSYDAIAVNRMLEASTGTASEPDYATSRAALIIPLYISGDKVLLWEEGNTWLKAWDQVMLETGGGNILSPYGDTEDQEALKSVHAENASYQSLQPFFKRYGVGEIILLKATLHPSPLSVNVVKRHITTNPGETTLLEYRADSQEEEYMLLRRAARDISKQINHTRENRLSLTAQGASATDRVLVLIPLTTLDSWVKANRTLQKLTLVKEVEVLALSPQQVDVMVHFRGPKQLLQRDLTNAGFRVVESGNYLIVSME